MKIGNTLQSIIEGDECWGGNAEANQDWGIQEDRAEQVAVNGI